MITHSEDLMNTIFDRLRVYVSECLVITDTNVHEILNKLINTAAVSCDFNYVTDEETASILNDSLFSKNELNLLKIFIDNVIRYSEWYDSDYIILSKYFPKGIINVITRRYPVLIAMAYLNYAHAAHVLVLTKQITEGINKNAG